MKSSSKLELAVDKNVFYTAAEIDNTSPETSAYAMIVLLKIFAECHTIVVNEEFLKDVTHKLKTCRNCNKNRAYDIIRLLNRMRAQEKKIRYVEVFESLSGVPRKDIDVASFALQSRDKILILADINNRIADEELASILEEKYDVAVFSCKSFIAFNNLMT